MLQFSLGSHEHEPANASEFPRTYDHFYLMRCCQFVARYCHDLGKLAHVSKTVTQKRLEDLPVPRAMTVVKETKRMKRPSRGGAR